TANATKGIESSELVKDLRNQTKHVDDEKVKPTEVEDQFTNVAADTTIAGSLFLDQEIIEVDFKLESMPDDEIIYVYRFEEVDDDDSEIKKQLLKNDEDATDNVSNKIDNSVPRMLADIFEERILELLSDTLKNILPDLLKDSVKKAMPKFDKRVKNTLKAKVSNIILKPLNREFNALNTMEIQRLKLKLFKNITAAEDITKWLLLLVLLELMLLKRSKKNTKCVNAVIEELTAAKHKLMLKLKLFKNITAAEDITKWLLLLQMHEIKRLFELKVKKDKSKKKIKKWVAAQAGKLGIPPPPELSAFELSAIDKKRKRRAEIIKEVFVKENIVVDGMHRNLVPPEAVVGSH
nr:hypothetical protein [Tanacetum cinerariifolium]